MITKRYLSKIIATDLDKKSVLSAGPRQSGKPTLAKSLPFDTVEYLNFDELGHRQKIIKRDYRPEFLIEVKSSDEELSPSLRYFAERIPVTSVLQLVQNLQASRTYRLGSVENAAHWLAGLEA